MKKSHAEQAGILLIGRILATLSEALVPIIIVRILAKEDFGILSSVLIIYMSISVIFTAGFPNTVLFMLPARAPVERRAIAWKIVANLVILGAMTGAILAVLPFVHWLWPDLLAGASGSFAGSPLSVDPQALDYLLVLSLFPIADLPGRILPNLLLVEGRPKASAGSGFIYAIGRSVAIILPMALGFDLWVVVVAITVFGYLYGALLVHYLFGLYRGVPRMASPVGFGALIKFGVPLGLTEIVARFNEYVDRYLILLVFPIAAFAEYHAGAWQIPIIPAVAYTVGTAYTPRFAELFKAGRPAEAIALWRHSIRKVALIVMPIAGIFIIGAEEAMEVLFTDNYLRGANVFRLYSTFTLGRVAAYGALLVAAGKPRLILLAASLSLASNVVFSVPLLLLLGFEGPALGTVCAFIAMVVAYCWCIARTAGLSFRQIFPLGTYLKTLSLVGVAGLPAVVFKLTVALPAAAKFGLIAAIVLAGYSLLGSLVGMIEREDWRFVWNWMRMKILR